MSGLKSAKVMSKKGKKGKNMKKKNTEIYIQDKKGGNGHALGQILKQALETTQAELCTCITAKVAY